jgi:hypothetical protein
VVEHPAAQVETPRQVVDKGPEADALHDAGYRYMISYCVNHNITGILFPVLSNCTL